ncbi:MAG TPA: SGNH/GDSL hydrolase family protein [Syntrophales bacterium]|nr:SGNH/GDSL hydrolase family protein [Syntrophales bacterium]
MRAKAKRVFLILILCISLVFSTAVLSHAYSGILAFGDSLSDNGNADGFGVQRFSNGPVWVEYMAQNYGVSLLDMAYGGATTGYDNPALGLSYTGLNWQVDYYLNTLHGPISNNTLVTVWAGANDFFQGRSYATAANNVELALQKLAFAGFKNFLVMGLPNIGATPEFRGTSLAPLATGWSQLFNGCLAADLQSLQLAYQGDHFYTLNTYALLDDAIANPGKYGFDNVTGTWLTRPAGDTSNYLFWDGVHPTTQAHLMLSNYAIAAVPEPITIFLLGLGLMGLAGIRKKIKD